MKKVIFMIISAVLTLLYGCEKENGVNYVAVSVIVEYPADLISPQVVSEIFEFRNITTGNVTSYDRRDGILLPAGLYDCSYTAEVKHLFGSDTLTASVQGMTRSVQLSPASSKVTVSSFVLEDKGDFIIQEVFYTGTLYPTGKQYNGTGYVRIYNNTDHVLYADGLAFMESKFSTTQKSDYTPDLLSSHMTVHAIYVIPGSGQEHPVAPGESLILCDTGIDHRLVNPNAFDLSHADFEWYDVSSSPSNLDIDSPTVPNLDPVGACIGNKGSRINAVINELNGEKIDIINYSENPADYIVAALSPAEVSEITVDTAAGIANVLVPENKLSLAIGKGGHNVRLAAKLTGYKIDVKPTTQTSVSTKSNDVVSTGNANIIIDDDFFSDIDE